MEIDLKNDEKITVDPLWCATANVKEEILFGENRILKKGTKHFRGGAKVYIASVYGGMCENIVVVGHHRSNGRYIKIVIPVVHIENCRLELVYSPKVVCLLTENKEYTKEYAEKLVEIIPEWIAAAYREHNNE